MCTHVSKHVYTLEFTLTRMYVYTLNCVLFSHSVVSIQMCTHVSKQAYTLEFTLTRMYVYTLNCVLFSHFADVQHVDVYVLYIARTK